MQKSVEFRQLQFLDQVHMPVVLQRLVFWSSQCRTLFRGLQVQFLDRLTCPLSGKARCSSWTRPLTCPLGCYNSRDGPDSGENCLEVHPLHRGTKRGVPAPQIMVNCRGDSACASHHRADCGIQCHRFWEIMEGCSWNVVRTAGDFWSPRRLTAVSR